LHGRFGLKPFGSFGLAFSNPGVMSGVKEEPLFARGFSLLLRLLRNPVLLTLLFLLLCTGNLYAQDESYLYQVNPYNFIRYDKNELHNFGNDKYSQQLFGKLEKLLRTGEGRINVVHIGGSHIQAGTFPGRLRNRFQQLNGDMDAGWGFMFPYRILRTNSPFGYYIRYSGGWQGCRNIERRKNDMLLGVGGVSATTNAPFTDLTILLEDENELDYSFNTVKVFCNYETSKYSVSVDSSLLKNTVNGDGFIEFELNTHVDSLRLLIQREAGSSEGFTLYGITTEKAPNGFVYNSIGVNGAHVPAFLRCQLFEEQMAQLQPDLVILGLGINDAYGRRFSQNKFEDNYTGLISGIRRAAPNTAVILTTNNDSYLYRRYVNKNGEKVEESMFKLAEKNDTGVWDTFAVMGGLNSVVLWERNHLAQHDKIHFTREGYLLMGDLFFAAFMQNFEKYVRNENKVSQLTK
jgi:lysophospholipase L1-like esterase